MLSRSFFVRLALGSSLVACAALASAAPILSIDFGPTGQSVESGFTGMTQAGGTVGGIMVGITGTPTVTTIARNPYVGSGSALYRDFLYSNDQSSTINSLTLTISGLAALTLYDLQIWSGDTGNNTVVETIFAVGALQQAVTNSTGVPSGLGDSNYFTIFSGVSSNASGVLVFSATEGPSDALGQPPRVNGFQLSASAVPEPGSLALLSVGLLSLGFAMRKKA